MAYSFDGGPPRGLYATVLRVMRQAGRDGRDYVWHAPNGLETVRPSRLGLGALARRSLRRASRGSTSILITRHEAVLHDLRYPIVKL